MNETITDSIYRMCWQLHETLESAGKGEYTAMEKWLQDVTRNEPEWLRRQFVRKVLYAVNPDRSHDTPRFCATDVQTHLDQLIDMLKQQAWLDMSLQADGLPDWLRDEIWVNWQYVPRDL